MNPSRKRQSKVIMIRKVLLLGLACLPTLVAATAYGADQGSFQQQLKKTPFKLAYENYVNNNWEIFVMNADGSDPVNITKTATEHEHYPQVSPDGTKICFSIDKGEGRDT